MHPCFWLIMEADPIKSVQSYCLALVYLNMPSLPSCGL